MAERPSREAAARPRIHLASASPRRREILAGLGVSHSWAPTGLDETPACGEADTDLVQRLAIAKARSARSDRRWAGMPVLAADTVVSLGGRSFGKPDSESEAVRMLMELSGRTHRVLTAVALAREDDRVSVALSLTRVRMRRIDSGEAAAYWRSGEPAGKAGGYAIQGLGGVFVERLAGSWSGVVGLPVFETAALLGSVGIDAVAMAGDRGA